MDYVQLIGAKGVPGSIATWVSNSLIAGDMPEIVLEAESYIYRRLRHFKMLTPPQPGLFVIGQDFITSPADMLEPYFLVMTGNYSQVLTQRTLEDVVSSWQFDGSGNRVNQQPMIYYFDQAAMRFDSPSDQAYPYSLIYYQQPAPLSQVNSNFLTQTYPRMMRCACMAAACEWMKDSGQGAFDRTYWDQLTQDEIERAQAESDRAMRATVAGAVIIGGWGGYSTFPAYGGDY